MVETNPMYDPRCNHDLPIPGPGCNRGMWTCRYPECTYPEAAPRRVRTQVERDADGTTWRHHEHGERISDGATDRPLPPVPDCCYPPDAVDLPEPTGFITIASPRRRWWHRYTRPSRKD